ncbi:Galactose/methyl galactoside import ATP-binding protein MglA [Phocoenobacter uteri]|uniref:Galactose/methyl galactoside import ATP-binding protein MglA n=1 Tax=Phocoenobacter uteri TaxID=146806 RepID=A0A379DFS2_9PAST|nr:Galactose/methyl galactoside import ATP-binding protein MglA [Phocoenobacter uteri]
MNSNLNESPYILEMRNVSKTFPGVKALDGINLKVKKVLFMH